MTYPHGTRQRYQGTRTIKGCRCEPCIEANREYQRIYRGGSLNPIRLPAVVDGECPYGQGSEEGECRPKARLSLYVKGCRGADCRAENRDYKRQYMKDRRAEAKA